MPASAPVCGFRNRAAGQKQSALDSVSPCRSNGPTHVEPHIQVMADRLTGTMDSGLCVRYR